MLAPREAGKSGQSSGLGHRRSDRGPLCAVPGGHGECIRDRILEPTRRDDSAASAGRCSSSPSSPRWGSLLFLLPGFLEGSPGAGTDTDTEDRRRDPEFARWLLIYRGKRSVLFSTSLMTIPVHGLLAVSIWLLATGLGFNQLSCRDYLAVYSISGILSTIPLPAGPAELGIVFSTRRHCCGRPGTAWKRQLPGSKD